MILLVGLGNPGAKYRNTRHNIGYRAVDAIAGEHDFGAEREKFRGLIREGAIGGEKVLILTPTTFMNLSGESVAAAARFYKIPPSGMVVIHDELDLAPGKLRVKTGGGHAGHNGLRSIHGHLGPDFRRVRIGIGHPGDKRLVSNYVLHDFAKMDEDWIGPLLQSVAEGAPKLIAGDDAGFMNAVARRAAPSGTRLPAPGSRAAPASDPVPDAAEEPRKSALDRLQDRFSKN